MFGARGIPVTRCLHGNPWDQCELCPTTQTQTISPVQMMPISASRPSPARRLGFKDDDESSACHGKFNPRGK